MTVIVGEAKSQVFNNPKDSKTLEGYACGAVRVEQTTAYEFLNITYTAESDTYQLDFAPTSES